MARQRSVISTDDVATGFDLGSAAAPPEVREAGFDASDIDVVSERNLVDKAQEAKFMEEKVLIEIEMDEEPNSPRFVYLGHNGVTQYVERGKPQAVRRKYLYSALAAKRVKMACAFGKDNAGNEFNRLTPNASTTYRVRLLEDRNPQGGMRWFQKVSAGAA
jgi:hypothetical protein